MVEHPEANNSDDKDQVAFSKKMFAIDLTD